MRTLALGLFMLCALATPQFAASATKKAAFFPRIAKVEQRIERWEKWERKHQSVIRFWNNKQNRWTLYLAQRDKTCWQVKLKGPLSLCTIARGEVRMRKKHLAVVQAKLNELEQQLLYTGNERAWKCIHRYEKNPSQGWATRTGNGYYGGLQMDISFQRAHGLDLLLQKGTANNWKPREQMMVAQRAHDGVRTSYGEDGSVEFWQDKKRGYYPWPNTARYCDLI